MTEPLRFVLGCTPLPQGATSPPSNALFLDDAYTIEAGATLLAMAEMLRHVNEGKLLQGCDTAANNGSAVSANGRALPSGPRNPGQGCEYVQQAILLAEAASTGGVRLRITLLAAGFIIGPCGASVRDISKLTGADIKSRTVKGDKACSRDGREFLLEGPNAEVAHALSVVCDAVQRYKELCEGRFTGQCVSRVQHVAGVDFSYQPPPRHIVPCAACLKGHSSKRRSSVSKIKDSRPPKVSTLFKEALADAGSEGKQQRTFAEPLTTLLSSPKSPPLPMDKCSPAQLSKRDVTGPVLGKNYVDGASAPSAIPVQQQQLVDAVQQLVLQAQAAQASSNAASLAAETSYVLLQPGNVLVPISLLLPSSGATAPTASAMQVLQDPCDRSAQTAATRLHGCALNVPLIDLQRQQLEQQLDAAFASYTNAAVAGALPFAAVAQPVKGGCTDASADLSFSEHGQDGDAGLFRLSPHASPTLTTLSSTLSPDCCPSPATSMASSELGFISEHAPLEWAAYYSPFDGFANTAFGSDINLAGIASTESSARRIFGSPPGPVARGPALQGPSSSTWDLFSGGTTSAGACTPSCLGDGAPLAADEVVRLLPKNIWARE